RAAAALRDLFANLAKTEPLILWLDDLQWGDADSARLLAEVVRPLGGAMPTALGGHEGITTPDDMATQSGGHATRTLPLLLVVGSRTVGGADGSFVAALRDATGQSMIEVSVDALTPLEASSLALTLLADTPAAGEAVADLIAKT